MSRGKFHTTRWTLILSARGERDEDARAALAELCETYWYPAYYFVRRMGHGPDEALDLTQGYFLRMLEDGFLDDVRPDAGKFRSFLLASLKHFMANQRRDAAAIKRGGETTLLSLDAELAERRYANEPPDDRTPEQAYERRWALAVLERVERRLAAELEAAGKSEHHRVLVPYVTGRGKARPYARVAEELDTTEAAVKVAVSRLRRRFGRLLREEIGETVAEPEIDDELRHLLAAVG